MTYRFAVSLASLSRLTGFISKEETRYYLNGVAVDFNAVEGARLVATNGHILGAYLDRLAASTGKSDGLPIVKRSVIEDGGKAALKAIKPYLRANVTPWVVVEGDAVSSTCKIVAAETGADAFDSKITLWISVETSGLIDGTFPDYRRVIPTMTASVEPAASVMLDPIYAAAFRNAVDADSAKGASLGVRIIQSDAKGESPMLVLCNAAPDFVGVWVPCRASATPDLIAAASIVMAPRKA